MSIKSNAEEIRDETVLGANTATRVGGNLVEIADDLIAKQTKIDLNAAKVSFDSTSSTRLANTSGTNTGDQDLSAKQNTLVSATNIKTINGATLLGSGDLVISGGTNTVNLTGDQTVAGIKTFTSDLKVITATLGRGNNNIQRNTIFGELSGGAITTGLANVFVGFNTGAAATNSNSNTFIGDFSGNKTTTGGNNSFLGQRSGSNNITGSNNTALGAAAGLNVNSSNNTFIGFESGKSTTSGVFNSAIGSNSLPNNVIGQGNIAIGESSMLSSINTSFNLAIGYNSLYFLTTGDQNLALGLSAGQQIVGGATNVTSASNSLFLGKGTKSFSNGSTNEIVIGTDTNGKGSNTVVLGNDFILTTHLKGRVNIGGSDNGVDALQANGSVICTTLKTSGFTVATLPTPPAQGLGARAHVTDALNPTYLGTLTGGGTVKCPVFYNGTAWVSA